MDVLISPQDSKAAILVGHLASTAEPRIGPAFVWSPEAGERNVECSGVHHLWHLLDAVPIFAILFANTPPAQVADVAWFWQMTSSAASD